MPNDTCKCCKGKGSVVERLRNPKTNAVNSHVVVCDQCTGKGYISEADKQNARDDNRFLTVEECEARIKRK